MLNSYVNYLKSNQKSERTIKEYTNYVSKFMNAVGKTEQEVTFLDVCDYQASIAHLSANSVCLQLSALKSYFGFLCDAGLIENDPTAKVQKPKSNPKVKRAMFAEDITAMVNACRTNRDVALVKFMASTGVRFNEMANITLEEYYEAINTDHMIIILGKGDKERSIFINNDVENAINEYLATRCDDCEYLFASFRRTKMNDESLCKTFKNIARKAGLPYWQDITCHWLRSAFATIANNNGCDIKTISEAMGHASISTTSVYIKTTQKNINNAMANMVF